MVPAHSLPPRGVFTLLLRDEPETEVRASAVFAISVL